MLYVDLFEIIIYYITIVITIIITIIIMIIIIIIITIYTIPRNGVLVITQLKMTIVITQLKMTIIIIIITAATNISYDDHNSNINNMLKYLN